MKIAIDLDGTFFKYPGKFKEIIRALYFSGNQIGVITAHTNSFKNVITDRFILALNGFEPDFIIYRQDPKKDRLVGEWKRNMIIENKIDILFDDFGGNNPDIEKTFFEQPCNALILKVIGKEN